MGNASPGVGRFASFNLGLDLFLAICFVSFARLRCRHYVYCW